MVKGETGLQAYHPIAITEEKYMLSFPDINHIVLILLHLIHIYLPHGIYSVSLSSLKTRAVIFLVVFLKYEWLPIDM